MNKLCSFIPKIVHFPIKDSRSARKIADHLIKSPTDSIILPFSYQPGPLPNELLSRKFGSLKVFEDDDELRTQIQSLVHSNYGNKNVRIYSDNLIGLSIVLGDETAQKRCSDIVSENISLPSSINEAHPTSQKVKFLVPLMNKKFEGVFLKSLYHQLSLRRGLCSNNLLEYYYLMSDRQFKFLDAKPSGDLRLYRSTTILYNTIFSMKSLETFDLATSFEIKLRKLQKTSSAAKRLPHHTVHLVRLKPRLDIIDALDARSLMEFRFLVNQMMVKRISLVLPFMKNWFKNCDQDIARLGITEKTRSGDLDKEQFLQIYMYLKERNDYRRSTFLQAVECYDEVTPIYLQN